MKTMSEGQQEPSNPVSQQHFVTIVDTADTTGDTGDNELCTLSLSVEICTNSQLQSRNWDLTESAQINPCGASHDL